MAQLARPVSAQALRIRPPFRLSWAQLGLFALLGILGFYLLYPLLLILLNSFNTARIGQPAVYSIDSWIKAWQSPGLLQALWNSLTVAFWYQVISFPVGVLIAWLLARTNIPWARGLEFMFWLSFFLPALSVTLGWMLLLDPQVGLFNQWFVKYLGLAHAPFNIFSVSGIIWVHLMSHAISTKVMLLTGPFRNMDATLEEASRMCGGTTWSTLMRITVRMMTPSLIIVFILGIVRLFESFEIELLLGTPIGFYVFSTRIVDLARQEPPQLAQATALGSVTLVLLLIAVPVQRWLTTRRDYTTITGRIKAARLDLGPWRWVVFSAMILMVLALVAVPLFSSVAASLMTRFGFFSLPQPWTLRNWQRVLGDSGFVRSSLNTLFLATIAAIFSTLVFSLVAYIIVRARGLRGRAVLDGIVWVPSVIPGVLAGLGLLWMFLGVPIFSPLYGSIVLLALATIMGGVTLSTQIFKGALLNLGRELEEASRMSGATALGTYFRIVLPLLAPTLVVVATLRFLFAANATSTIILLATSDTRTIALLTLDYVFEGLREAAAVTAVLIAAVTTVVALVGRGFGLKGVSS